MSGIMDSVLVAGMLLTLLVLGSSRLVFCIRLVALQGALLALLPLMMLEQGQLRAALLGVGTVVVKGVVLPWMILRARREAQVSREVEPYVGFGTSVLVGVVVLGMVFGTATRLPLPPGAPSLAVPVSLFNVFAGLFVITSRRKALTQILGFLILENGIFSFGVTLVHHQPLLVEAGVTLDLFAAVFVMGVILFHISQEFSHIDVDRLRALTDEEHPGGELS